MSTASKDLRGICHRHIPLDIRTRRDLSRMYRTRLARRQAVCPARTYSSPASGRHGRCSVIDEIDRHRMRWPQAHASTFRNPLKVFGNARVAGFAVLQYASASWVFRICDNAVCHRSVPPSNNFLLAFVGVGTNSTRTTFASGDGLDRPSRRLRSGSAQWQSV